MGAYIIGYFSAMWCAVRLVFIELPFWTIVGICLYLVFYYLFLGDVLSWAIWASFLSATALLLMVVSIWFFARHNT